MSLPNRTLRLLWICALWCYGTCTVDVSVAPGKACDADHPCSADRVCSADGICVVPSGAEVTDGGDDGGQDAGVIAPEDDGGVDDPSRRDRREELDHPIDEDGEMVERR